MALSVRSTETMRRGLLQPTMASISMDDDDNDEHCASHQSTNVCDNDEQGDNSSRTNQEESSQDGYESEYGDSDCSATSGINRCRYEGPAPDSDQQAIHLSILRADESATTTWTDEKHSSYLDSMEATFVQKMFDKEYCSVDVCGHSSHSSVTLDQECVESQPFCLNMRKPYEQRVAGLLTSRAPARSLSLVPSMWASPWIQHFKALKQNPTSKVVSPKKAEFQEEGVSTKDAFEATSVIHTNGSEKEAGSQSSHDASHRKRGSISSFADHKYAAMKVKGYTVTSLAGEYKKHKSQLSTLSHMDILMEKQYNSQQPTNVGANIGIEDGEENSNKHVANHCEHDEANKFCDNTITEEIRAMKEKQDLVGKPLQKLDQVVPLFQSTKGTEICGRNLLPDKGEEGMLCTHSTDPEDATTGSCTKTWTWGIDGPRYHLIGKNATPSSQGS